MDRRRRVGLDRIVDVPVNDPSEACFGGPELDGPFVASIDRDLRRGAPGEPGGRLLALDGGGPSAPRVRP